MAFQKREKKTIARNKAARHEYFVDETFDGSLPAFIAAFAAGKKISERDLTDIRRMLDEFDKEDAK